MHIIAKVKNIKVGFVVDEEILPLTNFSNIDVVSAYFSFHNIIYLENIEVLENNVVLETGIYSVVFIKGVEAARGFGLEMREVKLSDFPLLKSFKEMAGKLFWIGILCLFFF